MRSFLRLTVVASITVLAACQSDVTAPARTLAAGAKPSALLGPDESTRMIVDSTDARGNQIMIAEYAMGVTFATDSTPYTSVASVTIRTFIPAFGSTSSSKYCITSTIDKIEALPGWTTSVKKSGGCDKPIEIELENPTTRQKADFSFLYIAGKTRIDFGQVR